LGTSLFLIQTSRYFDDFLVAVHRRASVPKSDVRGISTNTHPISIYFYTQERCLVKFDTVFALIVLSFSVPFFKKYCITKKKISKYNHAHQKTKKKLILALSIGAFGRYS